jgi:hypothetical protein
MDEPCNAMSPCEEGTCEDCDRRWAEECADDEIFDELRRAGEESRAIDPDMRERIKAAVHAFVLLNLPSEDEP